MLITEVLDMSSLGERIRLRRRELGLTQSQLGGTDLTKGFISLVEKGRAKPSIDTLMLLARRLQRPISFFLEDAGPLGEWTVLVAVRSAWVAFRQGELTEAREGFSAALILAQQHHDLNTEAECRIGLGSALAGLGEFDLAAEHLLRGREIAETFQHVQHLARASYVLGHIEQVRGNLQAAREHLLHGYRLLVEQGSPDISLMGEILLSLGNAAGKAGDHADAARRYQELVTVLDPAQDLERIGAAHARFAAASRERQKPEIALSHLTRAEHHLELVAGLRLLAQARHRIGIMLLEAGKFDDAIAHLENGLRIEDRIGDDTTRARSLVGLAEALIGKRALPKAEHALGEAERLTSMKPVGPERARIQLVRARLLREAGNIPDAVTHYQQAITSFEHLRMRADLAHSCNELGELLIAQHRPSEAAPYLARALQELRPHRPAQTSADES